MLVLTRVDRDQVVSQALEIMRGWLKVMLTEINAEFPPFEFLQAFSPFNLSGEPAAIVDRGGPQLRRHLARLAHALQLDERALHWEYVTLLEAAISHHAEHGGTYKAAWSIVCLQAAGPKRNIEKVILTWLATSASSSGVEQDFSKGAFVFNNRQLKSDLQHERSSHRVALYNGSTERLLAGAQRVWRLCFGVCRASGSANRAPRVDKGVKRRSRPVGKMYEVWGYEARVPSPACRRTRCPFIQGHRFNTL